MAEQKPKRKRVSHCQCETYCASLTYQDLSTGDWRPGCLLPRSSYQEHQALQQTLDRERANNMPSMISTVSSSNDIPTVSSDIPTVSFSHMADHGVGRDLETRMDDIQCQLEMVAEWRLTFVNAGTADAPPFTYRGAIRFNDTEPDFFSLVIQDPCNRDFLQIEGWLFEVLLALRPLEESGVAVDVLKSRVMDLLLQMGDIKESEWRRAHRASMHTFNSDKYFLPYPPQPDPVRIFSFALLIVRYFFNMPIRAMKLLTTGYNEALKADHADAAQLPKDSSTLVSDYRLQPDTSTYLCCPDCYHLYPFPRTPNNPPTCIHQDTPGSRVCGASLWKEHEVNQRTVTSPILKYDHRSLKDWLARLLAVPGMEEHLKAYTQYHMEDVMDDIWQSPFWWDWKDQDGIRSFMGTALGDELRLLFGLGMDGFNPFQSKESKQVRSSTAIYLVCLNLPPHLRYLPENIYLVGVIPGHPSTFRVNNFLDLLVDDFLEFWQGVFFTRTAQMPQGRSVRAAIALVICDMLAARQVGGFSSSTSSRFCTTCALPIQNIDNIDKFSWPERDWEDMRAATTEWKEAETDGERERIFKASFMRWSSLNRLPYWNAVKGVVPDEMHFGPLGMFQEHCRWIWGINVKVDGGDGTAPDIGIVRPPDEELLPALEIINSLSLDSGTEACIKRMEGLGRQTLIAVCFDNDLPFGGRKGALARTIHSFRREHPRARLQLRHSESSDDPIHSVSAPPINNKDGDDSDEDSTATTSEVGTSAFPTEPSDISTSSRPLNYVFGAEHNPLDERSKFTVGGKKPIPEHVRLKKVEEWREKFKKGVLGKSILTTKFSKDEVQDWCAELNIHFHSTDRKPVLVDRLYEYMGDNAVPAHPAHVLGKSLMLEVRKDIAASKLPLGINKAPLTWGTPGRGKLSADAWNVICTIHLVVTLIRIWGYTPGEEGLRQRLMLHNFLDLVNAVLMASNRRSSAAHAKSFYDHCHRYLENVTKLYRRFKIKPVQHVALHFGDFLETMGPSHAYRTPGFERMNYTMQMTNTNKHHGEIEKSFLHHNAEAAALAALLRSKSDVTSKAQSLIEQFEQLRTEQNLGLRMLSEDVQAMDGAHGQHTVLPIDDSLRSILRSYSPALCALSHVMRFSKVIINGWEYACSSENGSGSHALINHPSNNGVSPRAGHITDILRTPSGEILLMYRLFQTKDALPYDMYYQLGQGFLTKRTDEEAMYTAGRDAVLSACVVTEMEIQTYEVLHILPRNFKMAPILINDFPHLPSPTPTLNPKKRSINNDDGNEDGSRKRRRRDRSASPQPADRGAGSSNPKRRKSKNPAAGSHAEVRRSQRLSGKGKEREG